MPNRTPLLAVLALCACFATGLRAEDGVSADTILIGQSAALTGPASELGTEMRAGAQAYFDYVNTHGGIFGRKIELKTLDDGYEPDRAVANTKRFIAQEKVFALFGYVGTPTTITAMPVFTEARVPLIGPFTGAEAFRNPLNRYIFNVRASYFAETEKIVEQLANQGMSKTAVFYQNDAYGKAGLEGVDRAMKRRNLAIVTTGTVERNTMDVAKAVDTIAKTEPQAVVMIGAYKSCAAFIKSMREGGSNPQFMNVSFVGSRALASELGEAGRGVGISQVVPFPWNLGTAIVREYQRLLAGSTGKENYSFTSLEGFISAKVLVEGLKRAGKDPTREKLVKELEGLSNYDLGGFSVSYSPQDHSGSRFVELTVIGKDGRFLR
jgi:ABC-type branched-subunit amino acid transport system substrate-binding protein